MNKLPLLLFCLCCAPFLLSGQQNLEIFNEYTFHFKVISENGQPGIQALAQPQSETPEGPEALDIFSFESVTLERAHLVIKYHLKKPFRGIRTSFNVQLGEIRNASGFRVIPVSPVEGDIGIQEPGTTNTIRWLDALERSLDFNEEYSLKLSVRMDSNFDCSVKPEFTFDEQTVHFVTALTGAGFIVLGRFAHQEAEDNYARYQKIWQEGGNDTDARILLDDAVEREEDAQFLIYAGLAIITADLVWYLYRHRVTNKKKKVYQYCNEGLNVRPFFQLPGGLTTRSDAVIGATLSWRF